MSKPITSSSGQGRIVIISGPSGSGKTTLHESLLKSPRLKNKLVKSISATTRPKRKGERQGKDYLFLSKAQFEAREAKGYFLEWAKVFDNYYGTPKRHALKLLGQGKHVLLCIDVEGAKHVRREFPTAVAIFIKPPSMRVLQDRLRQRDSESDDILQLRLEVARRELKSAKHYDYVMVNGRLDKAARDLEHIVVEALSVGS